MSPFDVMPGDTSETPFSPRLEAGAVGIRLAVPAEVTYTPGAERRPDGSFTYVPVSMTYTFSVAYRRKFEVITAHMMVVAVNTRTGASYSAPVQEQDFELDPDAPREQPSEKDLARMARTFATGYFTFNLAGLLSLPVEDATYNVHVTLEEHQSNVVTTELRGLR